MADLDDDFLALLDAPDGARSASVQFAAPAPFTPETILDALRVAKERAERVAPVTPLEARLARDTQAALIEALPRVVAPPPGSWLLGLPLIVDATVPPDVVRVVYADGHVEEHRIR